MARLLESRVKMASLMRLLCDSVMVMYSRERRGLEGKGGMRSVRTISAIHDLSERACRYALFKIQRRVLTLGSQISCAHM